MELPHRLAWSLILLAFLNGGPALANSPELPDQYAEVVLRVEGMI